jgi:PAS domain S-box-containing protein
MPSHALRRQLPLWITLVLTVTVVGIVGAAYYELHRAILKSVSTRLRTAAGEVATLVDAGVKRSMTEVGSLATQPALAAVVANETAATRSAALAALQKGRGSSSALAIWSTSGELIVADGPAQAVAATRPHGTPDWSRGAAVGKFVPVDSGFGYAVMAPIRIRGQAVAILSRMQRNNASGNNGSQLIARLVGKGSHLYLGNAEGDLWTDFAHPVATPAPRPSSEPQEFHLANGSEALGFTTPVAGTPWVIWMDLPEESSALAPAHRFRRTGIIIAIIAALLGTMATLLVVRRIARDVNDDQLADRAKLLEAKNQELFQSEERLRQLVEHSPDGIVVHREGRIIFANAVAARILGAASLHETIGRSLFDHLDPEDRDGGASRLGQGAGFEAPTGLAEVRLIRADGSKAIVEATAMAVNFDGRPAVQTILRDVAERRQLEDQLRQSQKM